MYYFCCATCAKLNMIEPEQGAARGKASYQCICYGKPRILSNISEHELKTQGCGDWIDPRQLEIKLF